MTALSEADLDRLDALAADATPGRWVPHADVREVVFTTDAWRIARAESPADASFIAAAREAVPQLVAEVRRLRAAVEWALGMGDDFPTREPGQGAYWWRTELWKRSGLPRSDEVAARGGTPAKEPIR